MTFIIWGFVLVMCVANGIQGGDAGLQVSQSARQRVLDSQQSGNPVTLAQAMNAELEILRIGLMSGKAWHYAALKFMYDNASAAEQKNSKYQAIKVGMDAYESGIEGVDFSATATQMLNDVGNPQQTSDLIGNDRLVGLAAEGIRKHVSNNPGMNARGRIDHNFSGPEHQVGLAAIRSNFNLEGGAKPSTILNAYWSASEKERRSISLDGSDRAAFELAGVGETIGGPTMKQEVFYELSIVNAKGYAEAQVVLRQTIEAIALRKTTEAIALQKTAEAIALRKTTEALALQKTAEALRKTAEANWAEVLEQRPDPKVVTDADFRKRIVESKLPWRVRDKKSGIEMLLVPPGKFVMGMSPGDEHASANEKPAHEVTITKAFYLGKTEVTQEQWVKVMQSNPSEFHKSSGQSHDPEFQKDIDAGLTKQEAQAKASLDLRNNLRIARYPVDSVSWDDCQKFCAATWLRLPTEAEWEYACRAGVRKPRYGELAKIAWCKDNLPGTTHPVGKKLPNALGFYDTLGNVIEWCNDYYEDDYYKDCIDGVSNPAGPSDGSSRVMRGGSYFDGTDSSSASARGGVTPGGFGSHFGFRAARTP